MKTKSLTALAVSSLLFAGFAHAITNDVPATLSITGTLTESSVTCQVLISETSVTLVQDSDTLIKQGDNATSPTQIIVSTNGLDQCDKLVKDGKIAYKFLGTADNADGTVLANALSDETAAKGVGIGIFDGENKPINVNTGLLPAITGGNSVGLQMVQLNNQTPVAGNINSTVTVEIERL